MNICELYEVSCDAEKTKHFFWLFTKLFSEFKIEKEFSLLSPLSTSIKRNWEQRKIREQKSVKKIQSVFMSEENLSEIHPKLLLLNAFFTCLTPILTFSFLDDKSLEFQQHWISKWFTKMTTLHLENNKSKNWIFIFSSFYGMLTGNRLKISKNNWNCAFTECRMFRQKWWSVDEEIRFANNFHLIERNSSCWTTMRCFFLTRNHHFEAFSSIPRFSV